MNLPTIVDLYHKEEMLEKIGDILMKITLSNGQKPLSRLKEAIFKSERMKNIFELTIICPSELGELTLKCQREIQRDKIHEKLIYSNWILLSSKAERKLFEELEQKLRKLLIIV